MMILLMRKIGVKTVVTWMLDQSVVKMERHINLHVWLLTAEV